MNTMVKFENQRSPGVASLAIRKNGSLSFNKKATEKFNLEGVGSVTLYYDSEESMMGIKPCTDEKDPSAFQITREKGRTPAISCQAFLRSCGVSYKEGSKVYPANWDEKRGMILVKLI